MWTSQPDDDDEVGKDQFDSSDGSGSGADADGGGGNGGRGVGSGGGNADTRLYRAMILSAR